MKKIIIGARGEKLKKIGTSARIEIEQIIGKKVYLELFVKTVKKWREKEKYLDEYGFNDFGLDEIILKVFSHNARAIHWYKNVGFIEYDVVKDVKKSNGVDVDEIYMKIKK